VKGREWYQSVDVAASYDDKRFSRGGAVIDHRERRAVVEALEPLEGKRVLEIACGTGRFSVMLADHGAEVVALDVSAAMLSEGRKRARRAGVADRIEFMLADAARLPFPDGAFESVFAVRFFHLAHAPGRFLAEMRRVASRQVFFDTFDDTSPRILYNWLLPMGSRLYSREEVDHLLSESGLELAGVDHDFLVPFGFYRQVPRWLADAVRRVDRAAGRTGLGDRLASVSYWDTRVAEGTRSTRATTTSDGRV
jgi:ubiquinone/menaquinone biosynthesis C-methylase UbiE